MSEYLTAFSSAAVTAALFAGVLWLARSLIFERLKQAVAFEYTSKLENLRADLTATQQSALESIRAANSQQQTIQATATASLTAAHLAGNERRLAAIDTIWVAVVAVKESTPPYMTIADLIIPENYDAHLVNHQPIHEIMVAFPELQVGEALIAAGSNTEVERARAFAGEFLYSLFYAYRAFTGRISLHFARHFERGHIPSWYDDQGVQQLLSTVLTDEELKHIEQFSVMRFTTIQQLMEHKMLVHIAQILSGEASATFGLQQAQKIAEASAKVAAESRGA